MKGRQHQWWVKLSHWIIAVSFFLLVFTGVIILMCHPRLYWGEVGNDLTPAILELPISRNYQHGGWTEQVNFFDTEDSVVSAGRTFEIFNQNGWGRSLHFLSGWILVLTGLMYLLAGLFTGHIGRQIIPRKSEFSFRQFWRDLVQHIRLQIPEAVSGHYNLLQKTSYLLVIFFLMPVMIISGLTMSPNISAAYPFLLDIFGGTQSARTIHFFISIILILFFIVHVFMVIKSGFKKQIKAMSYGN